MYSCVWRQPIRKCAPLFMYLSANIIPCIRQDLVIHLPIQAGVYALRYGGVGHVAFTPTCTARFIQMSAHSAAMGLGLPAGVHDQPFGLQNNANPFPPFGTAQVREFAA